LPENWLTPKGNLKARYRNAAPVNTIPAAQIATASCPRSTEYAIRSTLHLIN
jgi:hypothetical protein